MKIKVGARSSKLSRAQVMEVFEEMRAFYPDLEFETIFMESMGDLNQSASLLEMDKTNFFTKEIDDLVLSHQVDVGIHSAKDLSEPLAKGLKIIALTKGVDSSDVLILRKGETLDRLETPIIGISSKRRMDAVQKIKKNCIFKEIRGTIEKRLEKLNNKEYDAIVMAKAAIIRLNLEVNAIALECESAPLQGKLAVVALEVNEEMQRLFHCIDTAVYA